MAVLLPKPWGVGWGKKCCKLNNLQSEYLIVKEEVSFAGFRKMIYGSTQLLESCCDIWEHAFLLISNTVV